MVESIAAYVKVGQGIERAARENGIYILGTPSSGCVAWGKSPHLSEAQFSQL